MTAILKTAEELTGHLWRGLETESGFESLSRWEASFTMKNEGFNRLAKELVNDSKEHRQLVESLIPMVKTTTRARRVEIRPRTFDFSEMSDADIVDEIAAVEKLAKDLYTRIRDIARASDLDKFVDEKNIPQFLSNLERLINDELSHESKVLALGAELRTSMRKDT